LHPARAGRAAAVFSFLRNLQSRRNKGNFRVTTVLGSLKGMAITVAGRYFAWRRNSLFKRAGREHAATHTEQWKEKNECGSESALCEHVCNVPVCFG
jgi:hypothetical protein